MFLWHFVWQAAEESAAMAEGLGPDNVTRRTVLKGMAGVAGLVSVPAIIAACSTSGSSASAAPPSAAASAAPPASAPAGGSAAPSGSTVGQVSNGS